MTILLSVCVIAVGIPVVFNTIKFYTGFFRNIKQTITLIGNVAKNRAQNSSEPISSKKKSPIGFYYEPVIAIEAATVSKKDENN